MLRKVRSRIDLLLFSPSLLKASLKWSNRLFIISSLITVVLLGVRQLGWLQSWELKAFDGLLNLRSDGKPDDRLLIVGIAEEDIGSKQIPSFPLSDNTIALVLKKLQESKPKVIGLDIIRDVPVGSGLKELTDQLTEDNVISVCGLNSEQGPGIKPPPGVNPDYVGFANLLPDAEDQVNRRVLLISSPFKPSSPYPKPLQHYCNTDEKGEEDSVRFSFAFQLTRHFLPESSIQLPTLDAKTGKWQKPLQLGSAIFKPLENKDAGYQHIKDEGYQILLNYRSRIQPSQQVSLSDLLNNKVDPQLIRDRVVLIGYTASSVHDNFPTPYSANLARSGKDGLMPGVVIHAQIVSQMLSTALPGKDDRSLIWYFPQWGEFLWIWGWSMVAGLMTWRNFKSWLVLITVLIVFGILYITCCTGFIFFSVWLPFLPTSIVVVLTPTIIFLIDRTQIKPIQWHSEREEEIKKQQFERIERINFLNKLQEKYHTLQQRRNKNAQVQDTVRDTPVFWSKEAWLSQLATKADKLHKYWQNLTIKPLAQEKESIQKLLQKSQYLRENPGEYGDLKEDAEKLLDKLPEFRDISPNIH